MLRIHERGFYEVYIPAPDDTRREDMHQIDCFQFMKYNYPGVACCHIVNEGDVPKQYAVKLQQMGLVGGASDLQINAKSFNGIYGFAAVELKRATKALASPVSDAQETWLLKSIAGGGIGVVCYGLQSFRAFIKWYLEGKPFNK